MEYIPLEWVIVIVLHGADFGTLLDSKIFTNKEDCEIMKSAIVSIAHKEGDTKAYGLCVTQRKKTII